MCMVLCSSLILAMFGRHMALLRSASSFGRFGASMSLVGFVEVLMGMAIFLGTALEISRKS